MGTLVAFAGAHFCCVFTLCPTVQLYWDKNTNWKDGTLNLTSEWMNIESVCQDPGAYLMTKLRHDKLPHSADRIHPCCPYHDCTMDDSSITPSKANVLVFSLIAHIAIFRRSGAPHPRGSSRPMVASRRAPLIPSFTTTRRYRTPQLPKQQRKRFIGRQRRHNREQPSPEKRRLYGTRGRVREPEEGGICVWRPRCRCRCRRHQGLKSPAICAPRPWSGRGRGDIGNTLAIESVV